MAHTPIEIAQLKAENAAIDAEIAKLELRKLTIEQELNPVEKVTIHPVEEQKLSSVRWINTDNLDGSYPSPVVVHGADCNHLGTIRQESAVRVGMETLSDVEQWRTAKGFAADYNGHFYDEEGIDGCWDITFYPCTGLVSKTTTMTGFEN